MYIKKRLFIWLPFVLHNLITFGLGSEHLQRFTVVANMYRD